MKNRLDKYNNLRKEDFESRLKIYSITKGNKGFKLISCSKLKEENRDVYLPI
ncbi:hypothetical protein [Candidatus Nitrosocosmicus arcticus]|nr:hypothetical protein [Candidatus Nitrosocosmicus arcticus]